MTALSNVALSDLYTTWMIRTNQLVVKTNEMESIDVSTSVQANNANFRAIGAFSQANVANIQSVAAFAHANTVNLQSIGAFSLANIGNVRAVGAFITANAAFAKANLTSISVGAAYDQANAASLSATAAADGAVAAGVVGNAAFAKANTGSLQAIGAFGQANTGRDQGNTARTQANTAYLVANAAFAKANSAGAGKMTIWVPAVAMSSRPTSGAAVSIIEMATNKNVYRTLDFDASTLEFAQFSIRMPKSWDEGTVTWTLTWSHGATATNYGVTWGLQGIAFSDTDGGDVAFGSGPWVTDTGGAANAIYITAVSAATTVGGSPQAEDWVMWQVTRVATDGADSLAVDARLHGVTLYITTNASTDD